MSTEAIEVGAEPSLASILSEAEPTTIANAEPEPARAAAPVVTTAKAEPAKAEPARGPDGKFAAKPEATATTEAPTTEKSETAPQSERPDWVNGLIAERRKRQAAERAVAQPSTEQGQPAKPDFFENPERAVDERVSERSAELDGKFFKLSLKAARATHADYDEAGRAFTEAAQRDPRLVELLRADEDPGELIYSIGTQIRELSDVNGDIVRYREKVTAEARAQLGEKDTRIKTLEQEVDGLKKQLSDLSTVGRSLNTTTSARPAAVHETDDEPLSALTRFNKKT